VLDGIAQQIETKTAQLYPESIGDALDEDVDGDLCVTGHSSDVFGTSNGYLQGIDETSLLQFAQRTDQIVELLVRPGDFLIEGQCIARIWTRKSPSEAARESGDGVQSSLAIGITRTPTQDLFFLINQLVEVAIRALSPGVNDPFTAIQCIDQLTLAMVRLSSRSLPSRYRRGDHDELRVVTTKASWQELTDCAFEQLLPYTRNDINVCTHLRDSLAEIRDVSTNADLNRLLETIERKVEGYIERLQKE